MFRYTRLTLNIIGIQIQKWLEILYYLFKKVSRSLVQSQLKYFESIENNDRSLSETFQKNSFKRSMEGVRDTSCISTLFSEP